MTARGGDPTDAGRRQAQGAAKRGWAGNRAIKRGGNEGLRMSIVLRCGLTGSRPLGAKSGHARMGAVRRCHWRRSRRTCRPVVYLSISIRIDVISASAEFRNRAAATLSLFMVVLLIAIVLAVPDQHDWELGAELLVLAVALAVGLLWLDQRATANPSTQAISRVLDIVSPDKATALLLAVSGGSWSPTWTTGYTSWSRQ
jgi:hypothetical protein